MGSGRLQYIQAGNPAPKFRTEIDNSKGEQSFRKKKPFEGGLSAGKISPGFRIYLLGGTAVGNWKVSTKDTKNIPVLLRELPIFLCALRG
jgi:hypothetical protein